MAYPTSVDLPLALADALANYIASTLDDADPPEVHDAYSYLASEVAACTGQGEML